MHKDLIILILNALAYLLSFFFFYLPKRKLNVGLLVLLILVISHIGAIFYYNVLDILGVDLNITLLPFVYLYITTIMCLYPFLKRDGISAIDVRGNEKFIKYMSILIVLINIEPFFENIYLLFYSSGKDIGYIYEQRINGELDVYSFIGNKLLVASGYVKIFTTFVFFYSFTKKGFSKVLQFGLGIALINNLLIGINTGARGVILILLLLYFCCFLMMFSLFAKKIVNRFYKILLALSIPLVIFFSIITLGRYNSGTTNKSLEGWLLLYVSEGPIKFNNEILNAENNTNGDVNLCYLKEMLGLKTYTTYQERDEHYLAKNGRRVEVFYTFIGDFVSDFGLTMTLVLSFFLCLICMKLYKKSDKIPIDSFLFLLFIIHLYSVGFASNVYRAYSQQKSIFILLVIMMILAINRYNYVLRIKKEADGKP